MGRKIYSSDVYIIAVTAFFISFSFIYSVFQRPNKLDMEHVIKIITGTVKNKS